MEVLLGLGLICLLIGLVVQASDRPRDAEPEQEKPPLPPRAPSAATSRRPHPYVHEPDAAPRGSKLSGRAWVIDGDTIRIGRTKIRLAGIDAPELDMPFGKKSKWAMVGICKGRRVTAVMHGETSYDRQVATVYLDDGRDAGAELVKQGLALDLAHFSGGKYRALEPDGARRRLAYGRFGHRSLRHASEG